MAIDMAIDAKESLEMSQKQNGHANGSRNGGPVDADLRPESYLSDIARVTGEDGIRALWKHEQPGTVAGKPNPHSFPFQSIVLNLKPPLGSNTPFRDSLEMSGPELDEALQYGATGGMAKLKDWLRGFQGKVHQKDTTDSSWGISIGAGSQNLICTGFGTVLNPGDPVLLETPIYAGVLPPLRTLKAELVEVDVDNEGLSPQALDRVMSNWPAGKRRPKVLYVNPIGCNPSGCSHGVQRRLDILCLCKKHGILLFEDDPYYYLAEHRIPSYFELEAQVFPSGGRVVRFDSFSKLLSAGMRLGFATGPKEILQAIDVANSGTILHASSISQGIAYKLVTHWGIDGFLNHAQHVADLYAQRRETFEAIARKHLAGLATWVSPVAGMFLWIDLGPSGIEDSYDFVMKAATAHGVLAVPGSSFYPNKRKTSYMRMSFSVIDLEHEAEVGIKRLAEAIRDKQKEMGMMGAKS